MGGVESLFFPLAVSAQTADTGRSAWMDYYQKVALPFRNQLSKRSEQVESNQIDFNC